MDPVGAVIGGLSLALGAYAAWKRRPRGKVTLSPHTHFLQRDGRVDLDRISLVAVLTTNKECRVSHVDVVPDDGKPGPSWEFGHPMDHAALARHGDPAQDLWEAAGLARRVAANTSARWVFEPSFPAAEMKGRRFHAEVRLDGRRRVLRSKVLEVPHGAFQRAETVLDSD